MSIAGFEDLDYEDELPHGQGAIVTSSVKRIHMLLDFVMDSHETTGYTCNGVVTGALAGARPLPCVPLWIVIQPGHIRGCLPVSA